MVRDSTHFTTTTLHGPVRAHGRMQRTDDTDGDSAPENTDDDNANGDDDAEACSPAAVTSACGADAVAGADDPAVHVVLTHDAPTVGVDDVDASAPDDGHIPEELPATAMAVGKCVACYGHMCVYFMRRA